MSRLVFDIETDGVDNPSVVHCVCLLDLDSDKVTEFTGPIESYSTALCALFAEAELLIGHNIIDYDLKVLGRFIPKLGEYINKNRHKVVDTLVLSRLLWQDRPGGHSLEAWGDRLNYAKVDIKDFSCLTPELLDRCHKDVELNKRVYVRLMHKLSKPNWARAIELELEYQWIAREMHENGFKFDVQGAVSMATELDNKISSLLSKIQGAFPPKVEIVQLKTKTKVVETPFNPGSPKQVVDRLWEGGWSPKEKTKGYTQALKDKSTSPDKLKKFKRYGWKINEANTGTLPDVAELQEFRNTCRINVQEVGQSINANTISEMEQKSGKRLDESTTLTEKLLLTTNAKSYTDFLKTTIGFWLNDNKAAAQFVENTKHLLSIIATPAGVYVDFSASFAMGTSDGSNVKKLLQERISVLPAYDLLVEYLLTAARRRTITEWLDAYNPATGRIHGKFNPLGTRTQRCVHTNPNMGNVPTKKSIKYNSSHLRNLAIAYGGRMRSMWVCSPDAFLVGCDMEGAHLRIFAHLIDDSNFIKALVSGKKEDGTDPHSLNKRAFGPICLDRDRAKTAIFTYLNGGSTPKFREIFNCSRQDAQDALDGLVRTYPGLARLKQERIPQDARRGYFEGVDGRLVINDSEHHMIGMYLQNMESVLMKYANVMWRRRLDDLGIKYQQVNWVHDEWVTEVFGSKEDAELVGKIQADSIREVGEMFNLRCPMAGEYKVGKTWLEVH